MDAADEKQFGDSETRLARFQLEGGAAERYERWLVPFVMGPWVPSLLDLAELKPGDRVLDVACGTGAVSRLAARRVAPGGGVTGTDLNAEMLETAAKLPLPLGLNINWRTANALELPFPDHSFDAVLCQQGLQFFPDRVKGLSEFRRVLASGGRAAVSVWTGASPYFTAQREGLERFFGPEAAATSAAGFSLGDADELGGLLRDAGFTDVAVHQVQVILRLPSPDEFVLRHLSALPVAGLVQAAGDETRRLFVEHMKKATADHVDGYGVAVPQEVNVGIGRV
jgi:SAM-dependent methyltransferase